MQTAVEVFCRERTGAVWRDILVYNVHSLLHLAENAQNFGSLDSCSAFKFESYLHQVKKMVRSGKNVLAQVANRLEETSKSKIEIRKT